MGICVSKRESYHDNLLYFGEEEEDMVSSGVEGAGILSSRANEEDEGAKSSSAGGGSLMVGDNEYLCAYNVLFDELGGAKLIESGSRRWHVMRVPGSAKRFEVQELCEHDDHPKLQEIYGRAIYSKEVYGDVSFSSYLLSAGAPAAHLNVTSDVTSPRAFDSTASKLPHLQEDLSLLEQLDNAARPCCRNPRTPPAPAAGTCEKDEASTAHPPPNHDGQGAEEGDEEEEGDGRAARNWIPVLSLQSSTRLSHLSPAEEVLSIRVEKRSTKCEFPKMQQPASRDIALLASVGRAAPQDREIGVFDAEKYFSNACDQRDEAHVDSALSDAQDGSSVCLYRNSTAASSDVSYDSRSALSGTKKLASTDAVWSSPTQKQGRSSAAKHPNSKAKGSNGRGSRRRGPLASALVGRDVGCKWSVCKGHVSAEDPALHSNAKLNGSSMMKHKHSIQGIAGHSKKSLNANCSDKPDLQPLSPSAKLASLLGLRRASGSHAADQGASATQGALSWLAKSPRDVAQGGRSAAASRSGPNSHQARSEPSFSPPNNIHCFVKQQDRFRHTSEPSSSPPNSHPTPKHRLEPPFSQPKHLAQQSKQKHKLHQRRGSEREARSFSPDKRSELRHASPRSNKAGQTQLIGLPYEAATIQLPINEAGTAKPSRLRPILTEIDQAVVASPSRMPSDPVELMPLRSVRPFVLAMRQREIELERLMNSQPPSSISRGASPIVNQSIEEGKTKNSIRGSLPDDLLEFTESYTIITDAPISSHGIPLPSHSKLHCHQLQQGKSEETGQCAHAVVFTQQQQRLSFTFPNLVSLPPSAIPLDEDLKLETLHSCLNSLQAGNGVAPTCTSSRSTSPSGPSTPTQSGGATSAFGSPFSVAACPSDDYRRREELLKRLRMFSQEGGPASKSSFNGNVISSTLASSSSSSSADSTACFPQSRANCTNTVLVPLSTGVDDMGPHAKANVSCQSAQPLPFTTHQNIPPPTSNGNLVSSISYADYEADSDSSSDLFDLESLGRNDNVRANEFPVYEERMSGQVLTIAGESLQNVASYVVQGVGSYYFPSSNHRKSSLSKGGPGPRPPDAHFSNCKNSGQQRKFEDEDHKQQQQQQKFAEVSAAMQRRLSLLRS